MIAGDKNAWQADFSEKLPASHGIEVAHRWARKPPGLLDSPLNLEVGCSLKWLVDHTLFGNPVLCASR